MQTINNPTTNIAGCSPCTPEVRQRAVFQNPAAGLQHLAQQLVRQKAARYEEITRRDKFRLALTVADRVIQFAHI